MRSWVRASVVTGRTTPASDGGAPRRFFQVVSQRGAVCPTLQLEREARSGGMGTVWLAECQTLRRKVEIKLLDPSVGATTQGRERRRVRCFSPRALASIVVVEFR